MKICLIGNGFEADTLSEIFSKADDDVLKRIPKPEHCISNQDLVVVCCELNRQVIETLNECCKGYLVIESKVDEVGTVRKLFPMKRVAYSPSRFDSGRIMPHHSRVPKLVGGISQSVEEEVLLVYKKFFPNVLGAGGVEIAEAAKIYEDNHRLVNIAYANEFSDYCMRLKINPYVVLDLAYTKPYGMEGPYYPWVGVRNLPIIKDGVDILSTSIQQLYHRPRCVFEQIVRKYCGGNYDKLHEMSFLVVGLGYKPFSSEVKGSPIIDIIRFMELEGAKVEKYDMYMEEFSTIPILYHNSGYPKYDGILVFHPYSLSLWSSERNVTYFCRH
jgi:UDP-N-acetyl-D-mannosaminuronate dehydrogenase